MSAKGTTWKKHTTMNTATHKPLYRQLNDEIFDLNGRIAIFPEKDKRKGIEYKFLQNDLEIAKRHYARLATQNLESLAESLELLLINLGEIRVLGTWCSDVDKAMVKAKEALKNVS